MEPHLPGQRLQFLLKVEESGYHFVTPRPDSVGVVEQVYMDDAGIRAAGDQPQSVRRDLLIA